MGSFSNSIQGIEGAIALGLGHGFVSSDLFILDSIFILDQYALQRYSSDNASWFSVLFFILCLGNAGTPLTLNFIGEFMCLYGGFERMPILGALASSSIVFSAA